MEYVEVCGVSKKKSRLACSATSRLSMVTNDLYGKPFQLKFVRPGQMLLFANAVCDPPLGQVTVVPTGETVRLHDADTRPSSHYDALKYAR